MCFKPEWTCLCLFIDYLQQVHMIPEKTKPLYDIVVVGSNMVDMVSKIPRLPKMGETLAGHAFSLGHGGKGANQAVMAARLKARVAMVTRVGNDVFGPMTRENFGRQGVNTEFVISDEQLASGVAPIMVDNDGHNMVIIIPGANNNLSREDVLSARDAIEHCKLVICQLEVPDEANLAAFELARAAGAMTILNPAPARTLPGEMIALSDLIVPNETEAELLTGIAVHGLEGTEQAARKLVEMGAKKVIITLGEQGAYLYQGGSGQHFSAPKVEAVDSTGAGDAFIGSLGAALASGSPLEEAIPYANRAAALSATKLGTQLSFPTPEELHAFTAHTD